ncbi:MAG: hypothetical protein COY58_01260 [Gammaproteobacteria bacterium CG_4_10_14_0_8_um_filter_38_16]|nr:MAG: hypothetical protein COY58_01260 [Gammaproteobacteria bacterium CG_4_10_14_0_8_um_filter_38_16]PJA03269.1 MAG: hypothetical protein COX72_06260 [Gammaproteobacteria bacterium CG_4_10_14_0_2_um_filter_38_22]PJB09829.1 MAG: hypothetical protein CO120_07945 [Gammaproteobacteria bacterium CG_4_9_14_3_um_filter_38_9]
MSTPLVNILIPTYNTEKTIAATIQSIQSQTYKNIVITLVDNCSTDNTCAIATALFDSRCSLIQNERNIGGERNFSRCIDVAQGDYAAIYHADDIYKPSIVSEQIYFLENNPDMGAVFTGTDFIDANGEVTGKHNLTYLSDKKAVLDFSTLFKLILRHHNFLICPSAMVRTNIYKNEIKKWRGDLFGSSADLDVWLRIAEHHPIGVINEPLMQYRVSKNQGSYLLDRTRTTRAPFLSVVEHYFEKKTNSGRLTKKDMAYLKMQGSTDITRRTLNLMQNDQFSEAKKLTNHFWKELNFRFFLFNKKSIRNLILIFCVTAGNNFILRRVTRYFTTYFLSERQNIFKN